MDNNPNCIQFYVQKTISTPTLTNETFVQILKNPPSFVLHLDEVDISGICQSQLHCSLKYPTRKDCKQTFDCDFKISDCENIARRAKAFFDNAQSILLGKT